jgi:O-Antigen ligase
LYVIDIFLAITLYYALTSRQHFSIRRPFTGYIIAILIFATFGEIGAVIYSGDFVRPLYTLVRTFLAASIFLSAGRIIRTADDLVSVTKAAALGIGLTALLMIFSSLPVTKGIVASTVFSIPFLEPASEQAAEKYSQLLSYSTRGRSLVGVSILSGAFINTFWPLIALLARWPLPLGKWKKYALWCSLIAPFGIVMSYSRGAILGLFLVVGGLLFFGSGRSRRVVIVATLSAVSVFSFIGWDSDLFFFERVVERTQAMLTKPYEEEWERERIYAYSEPFEHLLQNPQFLFIGEGASIVKTGFMGQQADKATHAVFAKAYYSYGMIAAFTYVFLVTSGFAYLVRKIKRGRSVNMFTSLYYQAFFASLLGMLPWFVFGHAAVSAPRGAMLFFLLFGLIASLKNVEISELQQLQREGIVE